MLGDRVKRSFLTSPDHVKFSFLLRKKKKKQEQKILPLFVPCPIFQIMCNTLNKPIHQKPLCGKEILQ